ncbi:protease [Rhodococcus hoagii]|nr:protease [Prescottella equi]
MRSSLARRAAVFGSAALLLVAPAVAQAAPGPDTSGVSDQAAHLPIQLIDALQRDLQLTPGQYLERSEAAQKLAEFAAMAGVEFPDAFGGTWLDTAGVPVVGVAGPDGAALRDAAAQAGFTPQEVARSAQRLDADHTALTNWIATLPPEIANLVNGVSVDIAANTVVLRTENAAEPLLDLLPPGLREAARVVLGPALGSLEPAPTGLQTAYFSTDALLGGDSYEARSGGNGLRCSLGFNAVDQAGAPVNISAGHCDPSPASAGTPSASVANTMVGGLTGPTVGTFEKTVLRGMDYSIIRPNRTSASLLANNMVRVPNAEALRITGTANPVVGAPVCKAGSTTGFNCGVVTNVGRSITVGDRVIDNGFDTDICALRGDSGGPVVTGTQALGISSASNLAAVATCDATAVQQATGGMGPMLSATPINSILGANPGLAVRTS